MQARHPAAIREGARIAVSCPASPVDRLALTKGINRLRDLGFEVVEGPSCSAAQGLWAGDDSARADEWIGFLLDSTIEAVFAGRGGVGCSRLLPYLERLPRDLPPKWIIGRSDLTALQLTLWSDRGWIGISGPMVATDLGRDEAPPSSVIGTTLQLLRDAAPLGRFSPTGLECWRPGEATGPLVPANLSLLASMAGTPYVPDLRGAIVVLEEIDEPPQRIDRMLTQLRFSRLLDCLSGLVFGQFTACTPRDGAGSDGELTSVLRDHAARLRVPTLAGFPYGHERNFIPLPLGVQAAIRTEPPALEILEGAAGLGGNG